MINNMTTRKYMQFAFKVLLYFTLLLVTAGAYAQQEISSLSDITNPDGNYLLTRDASGTPGVTTFSGTLEAAIDPTTKMPYRITGLDKPLFTTLTGTVKNLVLEDVGISSGDDDGNTGAIACTANGAARIYNIGILSGSVGGTGNTGGLVGLLDGTARVVNCYSYATITGGTNVGGIVGYNNQTTTSADNNQKTMVMNCMFYGDLTGGTTKSPIYGGKIITNAGSNGVGNYNYFRLEAPFVQPTGITYNCALGAEDRFLKRFEFYRLLLNSHRELAGWWATDTYSSSTMLKWVLETADRTIDNPKPYPVLKVQGRYPSIANYDAEHAPTLTLVNGKPREEDRNKGGKFGTLTVNIQMGDGAVYQRPSGAQITTSQLILNITDKDPDHFNFNYYKVQLPYYNDVGTKNYNGNRVVTGRLSASAGAHPAPSPLPTPGADTISPTATAPTRTFTAQTVATVFSTKVLTGMYPKASRPSPSNPIGQNASIWLTQMPTKCIIRQWKPDMMYPGSVADRYTPMATAIPLQEKTKWFTPRWAMLSQVRVRHFFREWMRIVTPFMIMPWCLWAIIIISTP